MTSPNLPLERTSVCAVGSGYAERLALAAQRPARYAACAMAAVGH
jgi:hypothetical protein